MDKLVQLFQSKKYAGDRLQFKNVIVGLDGAPEELWWVDFINAEISNVEFENSKFSIRANSSKFQDVSFINCDFDRIELSKSYFKNCSFAGSKMVPSMNDAVFEDCNFSKAKLRGLNNGYGGRRTRFVRCDFRDCVFDRIQFLAGRLIDCDISTLKIKQSDLRGTSHNGVPLQVET